MIKKCSFSHFYKKIRKEISIHELDLYSLCIHELKTCELIRERNFWLLSKLTKEWAYNVQKVYIEPIFSNTQLCVWLFEHGPNTRLFLWLFNEASDTQSAGILCKFGRQRKRVGDRLSSVVVLTSVHSVYRTGVGGGRWWRHSLFSKHGALRELGMRMTRSNNTIRARSNG